MLSVVTLINQDVHSRNYPVNGHRRKVGNLSITWNSIGSQWNNWLESHRS